MEARLKSMAAVHRKPGSGKSLYSVSRLIQELLETERNIVTNLPLHVGRLNEYLQQIRPDRNCRLIDRLRLLSDDEIKEFYKFRGPEGGDSGALGVSYFLDEAHIAFNARDWSSIGRGVLHYLSQHRKLADLVFVITQAPGNLDKQFRSVAEDFTVLRNEYTAKFGIFRGRGRFVRKTYLAEPQSNSEPFETASFTLDVKGVASCYDTAKGIGVHGTKADIGRRAKGIPIWTVIPAVMVVALACVFVPLGMGRMAGSYISGKGPKKTDKVVSSAAQPASTPTPDPAAKSAEMLKELPSKATEPELTVRGWLYARGKLQVILSDGRTVTERDGVLKRINRTSVDLTDGRRAYKAP